MWTFLVWIFSAICYVPLYLCHQQVEVPDTLLNLKYLFILVPLLFTLVFLLINKSLRKWIKDLFENRFRIEAFGLCLVVAVVGITFSNILAVQEWDLPTILVGMVYFFCMAFIEEIVWRGYRLKKLMQVKKETVAILFVSIEWAIWHIPMWTMRNMIGIEEIVFWILYTVIVGVILGRLFLRYRNVLVPVLMHTILNACFLMPIHLNIIILVGILILYIIFEKINEKQ